MRKNKPIALVLAIALALVSAVSATFAWFTSNDSATNHLETSQFTNGDVKIVEVFDPKDPLNPGIDVNKDVGAVNTGSSGALLRISFAEVLRKLENGGKPAAVATLWNNAANTLPQLFDSQSIAAGGAFGSGNGWENVNSAPANTFDLSSLNIPQGVTVLYKAVTVGTKTTYQFVAYGTIGTHTPATKYDGLLQNVTADFQFDKTTKKVTVTGGTWNFWQFSYPATDVKAKWAALTAFPDIDGTFGTEKKPAVTLSRTDAQADPMIKLLFTSNVKASLAACQDGDWWYNPADGYFYYIGKLGSGQATKTNLLDAVGLDPSAGTAYNSLNFDLIVKMESIQNVDAALTASSGWGMNAADQGTIDLIAKLTSLNAFA
jgi:predicted ribosomally synthesized peptide with SipW-like signal peptide